MKEKDCDAISFLPVVTDEKEQTIDTALQGMNYNDRGEPINANEMGSFYDIILFQDDGENFVNKEHFQAILVCPYTYSERLMNEGFFGFIGRKTTTSHEIFNIFNNAIDSLIGVSNEQVRIEGNT
jgi:hypothetical protein